MSEEATGTLQSEGVAALTRMEEALELLDRCAASAEIAGHLDLAVCRLREAIAQASDGTLGSTALGTEPRRSEGPQP
jgi:hypothetical protein